MRKKPTAKKAAGGIKAWQDDPMGWPLIDRPVPDLNAPPLKFKIMDPAGPAGVYPTGTPEFRQWTAAEALRRGGDFWAAQGLQKWQRDVGSSLPVTLDRGIDLNAYYDRQELAFFHASAGGKTVYSGESPDVVCHELGHACLDALRPDLWDAHYIEAGAFHESFGDMSAILSALQLPSVRTAALAGVAGYKPSKLSRCAEQLGWAIRQRSASAVDADCLRDAFNKFNYVDPIRLPDSAPATQLCAEVHSFSRVFTGAFYEILSGMLGILSKSPTEAHLATAARDAAALLWEAVRAAPVKPNFFAQVAARLIDADTAQFNGKYRAALTATLVKRQLLPARVAASADSVPKSSRAAIANVSLAPVEHTYKQKITLSGQELGIGKSDFFVEALVDQAPSVSVAGAQSRSTETSSDDVVAATRHFVQTLVAHGRLALPGATQRGMVTSKDPTEREAETQKLSTHRLVESKQGLFLQRERFLCGCWRRG